MVWCRAVQRVSVLIFTPIHKCDLAYAVLLPPAQYHHTTPHRLLEDCGFGKGWVKGLSYAVLSLPCFLPRPSVAILAGMYVNTGV